jgi:hypothetical protein
MVRIVPDIKQKFIIYTNDSVQTHCLVGDPTAKWHKDIVASLGCDISEIQVLGGGKLVMDSHEQTIYVWGESTNYGPFPFGLVKELLLVEFPLFSVENNEPGIN